MVSEWRWLHFMFISLQTSRLDCNPNTTEQIFDCEINRISTVIALEKRIKKGPTFSWWQGFKLNFCAVFTLLFLNFLANLLHIFTISLPLFKLYHKSEHKSMNGTNSFIYCFSTSFLYFWFVSWSLFNYLLSTHFFRNMQRGLSFVVLCWCPKLSRRNEQIRLYNSINDRFCAVEMVHL